jgi:tRNA (guanine-N7-)-methyltransferase
MVADDGCTPQARGRESSEAGESAHRRTAPCERGAPWLRSYGRRRGRAASTRQAALLADVLPRVAVGLASAPPPRLADLIAAPVCDVWLEIGFGGGEHLLWQAGRNPSVGILGCEPYRDGIIKALAAIAADRLGNVRLFADDARPLLAWLPPASIGRAFILFPDPWPKKRHHKRRLIGAATLGLLARVLRPGAELRLATDVADYAAAIADSVAEQGEFAGVGHPMEAFRRPPDWPQTRYELKARGAGRACHFFALRRR